MARSTLMRVTEESAERVKERATRHSRTQVAEMDLVIAAGIKALETAEGKPRKGS